MASQQLAGWILVAVSIALLIVLNRVDLVAVLLPISAAFGYGITRHDGRSTDGPRKR